MRFKIRLIETDEGFAVGCPALPGCWSQGQTEAEALENIKDAIQEYLAAIEEMPVEGEARYVEVEFAHA